MNEQRHEQYNDQRIEAHVSGRVQGVWFRAFVQATAIGLGVTGYAENLPDGRVRVVATGPPDRITALIDALHEGPPAARVDDVDVAPYTGAEAFADFGVRG